ncbi:basic proline-rich protein-like [Poecile atricapillus]|uniref:basic proline-rich protein-like n=1 Tax=Poecile atricapillus TaxID=48891 RepID=UPI00273A422D|nr:basic proline-rich protein-like [Poecile atricapillus]
MVLGESREPGGRKRAAAGGAAEGDPPPPAPRHRPPAALPRTRRSGHSARGPKRRYLGQGKAQVSALTRLRPLPQPGQPGPGPGGSRQVPAGPGRARGPGAGPGPARPGPRCPGSERSAPRLRERSRAGGTEGAAAASPSSAGAAAAPRPPPGPSPAHLGVPLQAPRGRGICGAGGPAAPLPSPRIPPRTSARGALTLAHLSSPQRRGRPAPRSRSAAPAAAPPQHAGTLLPRRGSPPRADPGKRLPQLLPPTPAASQAAPSPGSRRHPARGGRSTSRGRKHPAAAADSRESSHEDSPLKRHRKPRSFF